MEGHRENGKEGKKGDWASVAALINGQFGIVWQRR
jgi:hypothetical protein